MKGLSPRQLYREEKEKAKHRNVSHSELMAEAKREFEAMLAAGQAARKSGRPKKVPTPPPDDDVIVEPPPPAPPKAAAPVKAPAPVAKAAEAPVEKKASAKPAAAPRPRRRRLARCASSRTRSATP